MFGGGPPEECQSAVYWVKIFYALFALHLIQDFDKPKLQSVLPMITEHRFRNHLT
jgi:hypothetical protein